jgi:hypothetical protein
MTAIVQVRLEFTWLAQTCYNITYWELPDDSPGTYEDLALEIEGIWGEYPQNQAVACTLDAITCRSFDSNPPFSVYVPMPGGPVAGTGTGGSMPTQLAPVITLSFVGEPPNRGRVYHVGTPVSNHETTGLLKAGAVGSLLAQYQALTGGLSLGAGTAQMLIARPNFSSNFISLYNEVGAVSVSPIYGTQRRRRIGSGS